MAYNKPRQIILYYIGTNLPACGHFVPNRFRIALYMIWSAPTVRQLPLEHTCHNLHFGQFARYLFFNVLHCSTHSHAQCITNCRLANSCVCLFRCRLGYITRCAYMCEAIEAAVRAGTVSIRVLQHFAPLPPVCDQ